MPIVSSPRVLLFSILTVIVGIFYNNVTLKEWITAGCKVQKVYLSPHYASWNAWSHPSRYIPPKNIAISNADDWNIHYHLGGYGPWIEKIDGHPEDKGINAPDGCSIEQVHMMSRHAERYPTMNAGARHLALLQRIKEASVNLNGSLSFLNHWRYFTSNPDRDFEQLTTTGPYSGTLQAFTTGTRLLTRYQYLLPSNSPIRFWASDCRRVIETARYFASGMLGLDWDSSGKAILEVIPETFDRRADTLTPGDTCLRYLEDVTEGHDKGNNMLARFQQAYAPAISERLISKEENSALGSFSNLEIFSMQEMCGFETIVRGSSPWCDVFTREDWDDFEYARDVLHYYRAGPGNPYANSMGWLWLNATASLLQSGPEIGTMFFSFVHDGDIAPFLTALEIMSDPKYDPHLPTTHRATDHLWRTSSVMPMGGRIILERMACSASPGDNARMGEEVIFLRVNINDKIVPLPYCKSGPGFSCPLGEFLEHVERRRLDGGDFGEVCGLEGDVGRITFLKQY